MAWTSNIDLIQKLYIAFYGRPADPGGLRYWASQLPDNSTANSAATRELISRFINSQEAQDRFGSPSLDSAIARIYTYAFHRDATNADKALYTGKTVVDVLVNVISVSSGPDYASLNNKLEYAKWFTAFLDPNGDGLPNDDSTGTKFYATFYGNTDATDIAAKLNLIDAANPAVKSNVLNDVISIADPGDEIKTNPPSTGQTFTLTSSSAILTESTSNGVTPAGKLTSANDTIDALNLLSSNVVIKDPSASDNDTMRVILTAAVAPLVQNIENIELTVTNAAADLQMTNIIGTKNVVLKGDSTTNGKVSGLPTSGGPTIVLDSGYNQTLTLAQTTDAGSNDSLTVQLKGTGSKAGLTINDGTNAGNNKLETLNLVAAGSAASTLTVSVDGFNTTHVVNTKVTGSQNLTLIAATNGMLSGAAKFQNIDATGHTGQLTLQIGANPTTPGVNDTSIDLTNYQGVDRVVLNANTVENVTGAASGIVVDANSDTAFASLTISGNSTVAATTSNADVATLNLTSKTGAIIIGNVTFTGFETLIINSTNVNHTIGGLNTTGSPVALDTVKIGGNKDLTLGTTLSGVEKIDATGFTGKLIMTAAGAQMLEIVGGDGADKIFGGGNSSSATIVNMGKGDDTYVFGAQSDVVTGGDGADTFDASTLANTILVSGVADKIMDFTSGVDKIKVGATIDGNTTNTTLAVQTLTFNTDLQTTLSSLTTIAANTAFFVKISGGALDGTYYLILNDNTVGFQASSDGVIQIIGSTTITADDIIA